MLSRREELLKEAQDQAWIVGGNEYRDAAAVIYRLMAQVSEDIGDLEFIVHHAREAIGAIGDGPERLRDRLEELKEVIDDWEKGEHADRG